MKKLKSVIIGFLLLGFVFFINSCSNDGYSLGNISVGLATVEEIDNSTFYLITGENTKLWIAASGNPYFKPKQRRVLVNYTILGDDVPGYNYAVKVNEIYNILTKDLKVVSEEELGNVANDPVQVRTMSVSGGFLNLRIAFPFAGEKQHEVNLYRVDNGDKSGDGVIHLEFRHDKKSEGEYWLAQSRVCFDLHSLQVEGQKSVELKIKFNTDEGEKVIEQTYNY